MTYEEFIESAVAYYMAHPEQHLGEALTNALLFCRPDIARRMGVNIVGVTEGDESSKSLMYAWEKQVEYLWTEYAVLV